MLVDKSERKLRGSPRAPRPKARPDNEREMAENEGLAASRYGDTIAEGAGVALLFRGFIGTCVSEAGLRKRRISVPLPPFLLPRFRIHFHQNVVISLVAIPPTYAEAAEPADRFRFRIPGGKDMLDERRSWEDMRVGALKTDVGMETRRKEEKVDNG